MFKRLLGFSVWQVFKDGFNTARYQDSSDMFGERLIINNHRVRINTLIVPLFFCSDKTIEKHLCSINDFDQYILIVKKNWPRYQWQYGQLFNKDDLSYECPLGTLEEYCYKQ